MSTRLWFWRAWTAGRERIADCGWVKAETEAQARHNAYLTLGGPHVALVAEMAVEEIDPDRPPRKVRFGT